MEREKSREVRVICLCLVQVDSDTADWFGGLFVCLRSVQANSDTADYFGGLFVCVR